MITKVILKEKPAGFNDIFPPLEDDKRVRSGSRLLDAKLVIVVELEPGFELKIVSAAGDNTEEFDLVVVNCLVDGALREVVLKLLLSLEETKLEKIKLEATSLAEAESKEAELDIAATKP
ncbi:hypothetical protein WAI453_011617 [Rhynchosporium graminicola]|uniref:Uncharacterized protein n=1 Tax=Rhynchosporium graminicola TaxID=2792576 RepID=A0A1E1LR06_9HELO|nr:uncharacterized protein RCO7_10494 [Rhynchosporium commune]